MRLNRGTLIVLIAALAVIIAVVVLGGGTNTPGADETATPAATVATGPLFLDASSENVIAVELRNNNTGEYVRLLKNQFDVTGTEAWQINGTFTRSDVDPAQETITTQVGTLLGLQYSDTFTSDSLADFGLEQPNYTVIVTTRAGGRYALYIGNENPAGNRYYVITEPLEAGAQAGQSTEEAVASQATAEATAAVLPDVTAEAVVEATLEAIAEATADVTAEAIAEATMEVTAEATSDAVAGEQATAEATADAVAEATVEVAPTLDIISEPRPVLSGSQQILLVTSTSLDPLIALISVPPYGPTATATPTATNTPNPFSEVEMTATATTLFATQAAQLTAAAVTPDVSAFSTAEVSVGEATAEATP